MHDERGATWRLFLPSQVFTDILAYNVDMGIVKNLSRVATKIDCITAHTHLHNSPGNNTVIYNAISQLKGEYSLIIIGKCNITSSAFNNLINTHLHPNGWIVFPSVLKCNLSKNTFFKTNLSIVNNIAYLPPDNPRIYIPIKSRRLIDRGLTFHKPGRTSSRLLLNILRILNYLGCPWPFRRSYIVFATKNSYQILGDTYQSWIESKLHYPLSGLIAYAGSDTKRRKTTILAVSSNKKNSDVVIKIGDSKEGIKAIQDESNALRRLEKTNISQQIPSLLFEDSFLVTSWVQGQSTLFTTTHQVNNLIKPHYSFLKELSEIDRITSQANKTPFWLPLNHILAGKLLTETPPPSVTDLIKWINQSHSHLTISLYRVHGDFTPWNIYLYDNSTKIFVYDWEDSQPHGLPGSDLFYFIYKQASLIGPWPGGKNIIDQFITSFEYLKSISCIQEDTHAMIGLWLINEYKRRPTKHLVTLAEHLNKLTPK